MSFDERPHKLMWELTRNGGHDHVPPAALRCGYDELELDEMLGVCRQLPALHVREVEFAGGEPLLSRDWFSICTCLAEHGIATCLRTKGLAIDPETLRRIRDAGLSSLSIALDGLGSTHDRLQGKAGLFRQTIAGIKLSAGMGVPVGVMTMVNAHNVAQLPALMMLLEAIGVDHWQLDLALSNTRRTSRNQQLGAQQIGRLSRFLRESHSESNWNRFQVSPTCRLSSFITTATGATPGEGCPAGRRLCGITCEGKVKGCLALTDNFIEGDLRRKPLAHIWFDPQAFSYARHPYRRHRPTPCLATVNGKADRCGGWLPPLPGTDRLAGQAHALAAPEASTARRPQENRKAAEIIVDAAVQGR